MLDRLRSDDFAPQLNQSFTMRPASDTSFAPRMVELIEVAATSNPGYPAGGRAPFSLIFRDPAGGVLPQAIYVVEHAALGPLEIFLVPIATGTDGTRYQAVFS
jgi:hypothetical protein